MIYFAAKEINKKSFPVKKLFWIIVLVKKNYPGKINYMKKKKTFTFNVPSDDFLDWQVKQILNSQLNIQENWNFLPKITTLLLPKE